MLDEFGHFTSALTDQANDKHIGVGVVDQHIDQGGFAGAGGGENADALADTASQQAVDDPNTGAQRGVHRAPLLV